MYVKIGKYVNWVGPYQIADKIFFWCEKYPSDELAERWDYKAQDWLGEFLAHGFHKETPERHKTWFYKLLSWIHSKQKRKMIVKIDYYDTWSMDSTLSPIILPMLKQLKATKHGSGFIDLEDVPEHMRSTTTEDYDSQQCFEFYGENVPEGYDIHSRYEWVLDEMIWAFEQLQEDCDWEDQYSTGEIDWESVKCEDNPKLSQIVEGPNHTYKTDWEARMKHQKRIDNGLRLFGKYYQTLWD